MIKQKAPTPAVFVMMLIHGGMEWLDTLSIKADEESHRRWRSVFEGAEKELKAKNLSEKSNFASEGECRGFANPRRAFFIGSKR